MTSGIICDGAQPSCAAKIAISVKASLLELTMAEIARYFKSGDGIFGCDIDDTIRNVAQIGSKGMNETDRQIVEIMCG